MNLQSNHRQAAGLPVSPKVSEYTSGYISDKIICVCQFSSLRVRSLFVFPGRPMRWWLWAFSLLERPENHHTMIRWDPAGEPIIVGRPMRLAIHVPPSIYQ